MNRRDFLSGTALATLLGGLPRAAAMPAASQRQALILARAALLKAADGVLRQHPADAVAQRVAQVRAVMASVPDLMAADPAHVRLLAGLLARVCAGAAQECEGSALLAPFSSACAQVVGAAVELSTP